MTFTNLASREEIFAVVGITEYKITENLGPNRALMKEIPYNNTDILYKMIEFVKACRDLKEFYNSHRLDGN